MGASQVYGVLSPEALDGFQILLEPLHALPLGRAKSEELDLTIAQCYAKNYLAATHNVHCGNLFGNVQGLMQRQEDEAKVEAHVRRLGHDPAEKGKLLKILPWRAAIMHTVGDAGVP
jgi:hypothetical protein